MEMANSKHAGNHKTVMTPFSVFFSEAKYATIPPPPPSRAAVSNNMVRR